MTAFKVYYLEASEKLVNGKYTVYNEMYDKNVNLDDELTDEDIIQTLTKEKYFDFEPFYPNKIDLDGDDETIFVNYDSKPYLQLKLYVQPIK